MENAKNAGGTIVLTRKKNAAVTSENKAANTKNAGGTIVLTRKKSTADAGNSQSATKNAGRTITLTRKKNASGTGRKQTLESRVESGNAKTSDYQSLLKMADAGVASAQKTFGEAQKKYTNLSRAHDAKASLEAGREFGAATDKLQEKKIEQARAKYNYDEALRKETQTTKYDTLSQNSDFAEKSRYNAAGDISNVMTRVNPTTMEVTRTGTGVDDLYYRAVNGDAKALEMIPEAKKSDSLAMSYLRDGNNISHMTEREIANFNYLYAQDEADGDTSHKNAWEYIEFITPDLNKRQRDLTETQATEYAAEHPIGSSLTSIAMSVPKGASYVGQAIDYFDDGKLDQNANYNRFGYTPTAIREEVGSIVENRWGATGSFLYQTGMSMGDFLFGALMGNAVGGAIGGGAKVFALGVMGTGAAADTAIEAKDSGMDDTRAFIKATVAGSAEILTENMGWDALFDKALLGKSTFTYIAKNILSEGFEEGSSDIINWVADDLYDVISGQTQSEWKQQIYEYMNSGYSYEEACGLAIGARYQELGLDMLGGALSGGIMASVGAGVNASFNNIADNAALKAKSSGIAKNLEKSGIDKKTSTSLAKSIQTVLDGGKISNKAAANIAKNPTALSLLEETAEVEINRDVPLSELKSQIKSIAETAKARQTAATQEQTAQGESLNTISEITPVEAQNLSERATDGLRGIEENSANIQAENNADIIDNSNANINAVNNNLTADEAATANNTVNDTVDTVRNSTNNAASITNTNADNSNVRSAAAIKADRAYMRRAGAIFGENGAKAINTAYDNTVASQYAADDIIKGFSRVYNAVLSGNDAPNVDIPESVRTAAIGAAELDAERAANAKSYSGESGLVRDINLKKASTTRTQRKVLDHVGKALGVQVRLVDNIIDENGQNANGQYQDGVLLISLKSDDPLLTTAIHEAVHRIRETSPASYQELSQFVRETLTDRSMRDVFLPGYKQIYQNSDAGFLTEEIVADAMGRVMSDERAVRRFTEMHRDLAKTLRDMLSDIITTIKRAVHGQKTIELSEVQKNNMREVYARMDEAVKLFDKALEETAKKQSTNKNTAGAESKGGARYSSTAINDDSSLHTEAEQRIIAEFKNSVDSRLVEFAKKSIATSGNDSERYYFHNVPERAANDIYRITGIDAHGFKTAIENRMVRHIFKDHGENGLTDHSMSDINDFARIQYVLDNYDNAYFGGHAFSYTTVKPNGKPGTAKTVVYEKAIDNTFYVVEAVPNTKAKTAFVVSAYMTKKKGAVSSLQTADELTSAQMANAKNAEEKTAPEKRLTNAEQNVKSESRHSKKSAEVEGQMADALETERLLQEQMQEYEELQKENKELLLKNKRLEKENSSAELKNQTLQSKLRSEKKTSGEEIKNLKKQNRELEKSRDKWKHETKLTEKRGVDREAVKKQVRDILKSYDIPLESNEENGNLQSLTDQLQSLYDGMTFGVDENGNDFSSDDAFNMAKNIAETIAGKFTAPGEAWQNYGDLLDFVRDTPIVVSDYYHSDVNGGEYGAFRQKNFGRLKLVSEKYALKKYGRKGGMGIDVFWQYLMERYPGLFNDDAVGQTTVPEQLEYLNKVLDDVAASRYENAWEGSTDEDFDRTTTDIANDLLESFFDIPQVKKTVMDRQVEKLTRQFGKKADRYETRLEKKDERLEKQKANFEERLEKRLETAQKNRDKAIERLRKKNAENVKKQLEDVRKQRDKAIEKLEDKYKAKTEAGREKQKQRVLRDKITRHVSALSQKLLRATDTKHIPQELQGVVAKLLESINLESPYTIAEDGKHIPRYTTNEAGNRLENQTGTLTKRSEAFREMRDIYRQLEAEGTLTIDPDMQQRLDEVAAIKDVPLNLLTSDELQKIWDAVKMIESNVSKAGKTLASEKFETRLEWARDIERDAAGRRSKTSKLFKNSSSLALSLENPYTFFSHFGKSGMAIYRMLRNAQDREQTIIDRVVADTQKIAPSETVTEDMQTAHTLYLGEYGEKIVLTTDQLMDLYLLTRRKAAEGHLFGGGVVQPELSGEYTLGGKKQKLDIEHGDRGIALLKEDISYIASQLTPAQKLRAAALQNETHVLAAYGNEASMKAYGYEKFTEKDYWTIKSYSGNIRQEVGKRGEGIAAIKNVGSAKALTPNARNAVELQGVYKTFANHVSDMSTYAAWLCPMEDMNALYNFRFKDALGNDTGNMKQIIERVAGRGAGEYWTKLEGDIQNGITAKDFEPMTTFFSKSIGAFKGAAVGANLRVVIQQPTAFFRASAILSPKNMAKGIKHGVTDGNAWEKAVRYAPIAARKQMGGFDIANSGRMIDTLFDQRGKIDKLNEKLSVGAEKADEITWGKLWNACEWQTAEKYPALEAGSAEFYEKAAEIFTDTIDQSQVVDGVLQRANIMRSRNETAKQATSFMGEPLMALNMMMRAYDSIRYENDAGRRTKAIKNAGRVATALVITNVVNALAQSLPDAWRDDDKDKKYWERFWAAFTGIDGSEETAWDKAWNFIFEGNLGGNLNITNNIPFVKDALSIMQGYDVSRTEMEIVSDFLTAAETMLQTISGKSPKTAKYAFANFMAAAGKFFGLPVSNIKRDVWGLIRSAAIETESIPLQYELEKAIYKIDDTQNKSRFLDLLYMALENNDMDAYNHIHDELMTEMQLDGKTIENGLQSRYNKRIKSDSGYSLTDEQRALFGSYDKISSSGSSDSFSSADLTKEQYDAYSAQRAENWKNISDELAENYDFQDMDENTQASVLEDAYKLAQEIALQDNSNGGYEITTAWKAGYGVAEYAGIGLGEYVLYHKIWQSTDKLKNGKGNTIANSQGLLFMEKLYDIGLTKKQVGVLCDCYGLSDTISDYSKKEVAAALKKMEV